MNDIEIAGRKVGPDRPCFIVAEIGINHNGDMDLARRTIDAACAAGADSVKFQNYRTEDFISDREITYEYVSRGAIVRELQFDMFKRCELGADDLAGLAAYCRAKGVVFHSTPTSEAGVAELVGLGVPVLKNGSDYLTHLPLIHAMGLTGLATVLSTGMARLDEIDEAVRAFRQTGNVGLILLHCVSRYPTPPADLNLRKIPSLAAAFACPVGFSDHSEGTAAAVAALALGACWIEKHFTLDKTLPGPDHRFSADPAEFALYVRQIRIAEQGLGSSAIGPTAAESASRDKYRLSCVAGADLAAGACLGESDIAFRRPGTGLRPAAIDLLVGRRLRDPVRRGHVFAAGDFQ
ncbi:MAG: N-acetylneuraminate synthase family protein [Pseudomonadota bacterium]